MAIYHLEAKVISRGAGRSAVAAAAYMSCSTIYNDYDGITHDFTRKHGLIWQEVFLPSNAPPQWHDRSILWNAVEENENTKDSRLAREFVVALPVELDPEANKELLKQYVNGQFVDDGMCADVAVHDTDGHNPHAHIMLTVRPLDEQGNWQYKTEKEYLCMKDGVEKGFTAKEYKEAAKEGWEKQYRYKVGKKKVWLPPSKASEYERVDKHPKSTKYGRQNPITARWNSEEQLLIYREAWAATVNQNLEAHGFKERIDHRSFAELGITAQPTIHEGVYSNLLAKQGIVSDRKQMNQQIKEDNKLLRELNKLVSSLVEKVKQTIPNIAEALEELRGHMIILEYQLLSNLTSQEDMNYWLKNYEPSIQEYKELKKVISQKQKEKKTLLTEKDSLSFLNPIRHLQINQKVAELTEDIEELKFKKSNIMLDIHCHTDEEVKEVEKTCKTASTNLEILQSRNQSLNKEIETDQGKYSQIKATILPEQEPQLLDERISKRPPIQERIRLTLDRLFGKEHDWKQLDKATKLIEEKLGEDPYEFKERSFQLRWEEEQKQSFTLSRQKETHRNSSNSR